MLIATSLLLLVNAVFAVVVWPPFLRRVSADERARDEQGRATRFLTVHRILIGCALGLALASAVAGVAGLIVAA